VKLRRMNPQKIHAQSQRNRKPSTFRARDNWHLLNDVGYRSDRGRSR
jgi:hypothetical protein